MQQQLGNRGLSLTEVIISLFLLSFVALSILSMFQTGFIAQKRIQRGNQANFIMESLTSEIREWATDYDNFISSWPLYNRTYPAPENPDFTITVRAIHKGLPALSRPLYSPSEELESQWVTNPRGPRVMPTAIVPVEISVSWSPSPSDRVTSMFYVGEPYRDPTGAVATVTGPTPNSVGVGASTEASISVVDASNRPFENLLFRWEFDSRYLEHAPDSLRDGRTLRMTRLPDPPNPPFIAPPPVSPVQAYARYAGIYIPVDSVGIGLP